MKPDVQKQRGWVFFSLFVLLATLAGMGWLLAAPYLRPEEARSFSFTQDIFPGPAPFAGQHGASGLPLPGSSPQLYAPAGHALLLRAWQAVNTSAVWGPLLLVAGFSGMMATGYRILRCSEIPKAEALLLVALLASSPLLAPSATVLHPDPYEAWGTLYTLSVLYRYSPRKTGWWKLRTGLAVSCFLWISYPFAVAAGITCGLIFCKILLKKDNRLWSHLLLFLLPQMISAALVYGLCLRPLLLTGLPPGTGFSISAWTFINAGIIGVFFLLFPFRERFCYPIHLGRFAIFTALLAGAWTTFAILFRGAFDPIRFNGSIGLHVVALLCLCMVVAVLLSQVPVRYKPLTYVLLAVLALYRPALRMWNYVEEAPARLQGTCVVPKPFNTTQERGA